MPSNFADNRKVVRQASCKISGYIVLLWELNVWLLEGLGGFVCWDIENESLGGWQWWIEVCWLFPEDVFTFRIIFGVCEKMGQKKLMVLFDVKLWHNRHWCHWKKSGNTFYQCKHKFLIINLYFRYLRANVRIRANYFPQTTCIKQY